MIFVLGQFTPAITDIPSLHNDLARIEAAFGGARFVPCELLDAHHQLVATGLRSHSPKPSLILRIRDCGHHAHSLCGVRREWRTITVFLRKTETAFASLRFASAWFRHFLG